MALDAAFIARLARELDEMLSGARVDKIHEPERDDIVLALRAAGVRGKKLIVSVNPSYPRVNMTTRARENPTNAPMFCMLLRKHLTNGKIIEISSPRGERIIDIKFEVSDEMGVLALRTLTAELMGRHSNIILRDENDRIIECLKRVDIIMSERRQVLPGLFYELPPRQEKLDPEEYSEKELSDIICRAEGEMPVEKWIISTFLGLSPLLCREFSFRACGDVSARMCELSESARKRLASAIYDALHGSHSPSIVYDGKRPIEFSFFPITQYGDMQIKLQQGLSDTLEEFYDARDAEDSMHRRSQGVLQVVRTAHSRVTRKLALQREELKKSAEREKLRERAELISANIYRLDKGMTSFTAENYFAEGAPEITIKLDPQLSPQENSAKLFRDYRKLKNAEKYLTEQIASGENEIIYLESVLESIEKAESVADIAEIREELSETGYVDKNVSKRALKRNVLRPYRFKSSDGFTIYAGRNNKQNEALTLKSAMKGDMWLHTKNIPGSHVIIECAGKEVPDRTLEEAAIIAAYYSRARESVNVPVDYTQVRNVKKPPGTPPGMVIYSTSRTAFVTPDEELVKRLSKE